MNEAILGEVTIVDKDKTLVVNMRARVLWGELTHWVSELYLPLCFVLGFCIVVFGPGLIEWLLTLAGW